MDGDAQAMSQRSYASPAGTADAAPAAPTGDPKRGPQGGGTALPRKRRFGTESLFRWLSTGAGATVLVIAGRS